MTENEVISRIKQGDEAKKKVYAVDGWLSLIIFAIWLGLASRRRAFTCYEILSQNTIGLKTCPQII